MNRSGLTFLELLLSLALLSSLTLVSVGWSTTSARTSRAIDAQVQWEMAARATLEIIGEDLIAGDLPRRRFNSKRLPDWIYAEGSELVVEVRAAPFSENVLAEFTLDRDANQLSHSRRSQGKKTRMSRILLGDVAAFETRLSPASTEPNIPARLDVRIVSGTGWTAARAFWIRDRPQP